MPNIKVVQLFKIYNFDVPAIAFAQLLYLHYVSHKQLKNYPCFSISFKNLYITICRFMFLQTQKVLKDFHQALLCLKQIFIPENHGVNIARLVVFSAVTLDSVYF